LRFQGDGYLDYCLISLSGALVMKITVGFEVPGPWL
jgi:hypothetical protein